MSGEARNRAILIDTAAKSRRCNAFELVHAVESTLVSAGDPEMRRAVQ
jgi:hypothetical protein